MAMQIVNSTADNALAEQAAVKATCVAHIVNRSSNTNKQYLPRQEEFRNWCLEGAKYGNYTVSRLRLLRYLREYVVPKGNGRKKRKTGSEELDESAGLDDDEGALGTAAAGEVDVVEGYGEILVMYYPIVI
ncbi:hypothetical protein HK104_007225 [Borealophlyctis nickersoniae]|nr:hypothetical protein HK104_007225 [Borealophlyctis nickersoniae]